MSRHNTLYNVIATSRPFKGLTFAEAALRLRGGIILGLLAAGLISSAAGQQANTAAPDIASLPVTGGFDTATSLKAHPGWVQIPGALIRPDCVHEIPNGADVVISDNKITGDVTLGGVLVAHYDPCPEAPVITRPHEGSSQTVIGAPGTGNGWVEALKYQVPLSSGDNIDYLYGTWTVLTNPSANGGLLYLFNGVVSSDKNWILQPVLQWGSYDGFGGNYWVIASWLVGNNGYVFHSPAANVSPGHTIGGYTWVTSASGGTLHWEVYAYDQTSGAYSWITAHSTGLQWNWAYAGVLEADGITSCSEFPPAPAGYTTNGTWFQNSALYTGYPNYTPTPAYWYGAWGNYYGWSGPYCGFSATPNSGGGLLTYY